MDRLAWVGIAGFVLVTVLSLHGLLVDAVSAGEMKYGLVYDWVFMTLLLAGLYWTYGYFHQTWWGYSLVVFAIVLHVAGAVFFYGVSWRWVQFDMVMHAVSGGTLYFVVRRALFGGERCVSLPLFGASAVLVIMGLSAVHELIEFVSYGVAGGGPGLFTSGGDMVTDYVDLNVDLACGLVGGVLSWCVDVGRDVVSFTNT